MRLDGPRVASPYKPVSGPPRLSEEPQKMSSREHWGEPGSFFWTCPFPGRSFIP